MNRMLRIAIVALLISQLAVVTIGWPRHAAAQTDVLTYDDPGGQFTMEFQAPWEIVRQDDKVTVLSDGTLVVIPVLSMGMSDGNLTSCLQTLVLITTGLVGESDFPVLAEGHTT